MPAKPDGWMISGEDVAVALDYRDGPFVRIHMGDRSWRDMEAAAVVNNWAGAFLEKMRTYQQDASDVVCRALNEAA